MRAGTRIFRLGLRFSLALAMIGPGAASAELLIDDASLPPQEILYAHPALRSLVFVSPEARAQAILPPAPVFVAPAPLIWRAPGVSPLTPPPSPLAFNRSGSPSNRDLSAYAIARAHAFSQNLYRRDGAPVSPIFLGYGGNGGWFWIGEAPTAFWLTPTYPPPAPGASHPSNRDNAASLLERAHRFSQDAYRRP